MWVFWFIVDFGLRCLGCVFTGVVCGRVLVYGCCFVICRVDGWLCAVLVVFVGWCDVLIVVVTVGVWVLG